MVKKSPVDFSSNGFPHLGYVVPNDLSCLASHPSARQMPGLPIRIPLSCNWLVALTILKNMKVNGKDYPIYYGK